MARFRRYRPRLIRKRLRKSRKLTYSLRMRNPRNWRYTRKFLGGTRGAISRNKIPRPLNLQSDSRTMRHVYYDNVIIPANATPNRYTGTYVYPNNMWGPFGSFTGHQPYLFDQAAQLYANYTVLFCKVQWIFPNSVTTPLNFVTWIDDQAAAAPTAGNQHLYFEKYGGHYSDYLSSRSKPLKLTAYYDARKYWKTNLAGLLADDSQKTLTNSAPANTVFCNMLVAPTLNSGTVPAIPCTLRMVFVTMYRDPLPVTES